MYNLTALFDNVCIDGAKLSRDGTGDRPAARTVFFEALLGSGRLWLRCVTPTVTRNFRLTRPNEFRPVA